MRAEAQRAEPSPKSMLCLRLKKFLGQADELIVERGRMSVITMLFLIIILFPSFSFAGQIYGSIKRDGNFIEGVQVEIRCASSTTYSAQTDMYGSYSIYVPETGKCTLTANSLPIEIYSFDSPIQYNLVLENNSLRRE